MRYGRVIGVSAGFFVLALGALFVTVKISKTPISPPEPRAYAEVNGQVIFLEVADTDAARAQGLSGRDFLPTDRGMLFLFPNAGRYGFWMKEMRFPIDIVWMRQGTVLGVEADADPQRGIPDALLRVYYPPVPADQVLELPGGRAAALGIEPGAIISFRRGE